jgi:hypothetical protein
MIALLSPAPVMQPSKRVSERTKQFHNRSSSSSAADVADSRAHATPTECRAGKCVRVDRKPRRSVLEIGVHENSLHKNKYEFFFRYTRRMHSRRAYSTPSLFPGAIGELLKKLNLQKSLSKSTNRVMSN